MGIMTPFVLYCSHLFVSLTIVENTFVRHYKNKIVLFCFVLFSLIRIFASKL